MSLTAILIIGLIVCPSGIVVCFAIFAAAERADRREERHEAELAEMRARLARSGESRGRAYGRVLCLPPTEREQRTVGDDAERWLRRKMWREAGGRG